MGKENKAPPGAKDEGKYFELEGALDGQVVVRFPPEASGYLHIGHAKAALLNAHYQQAYHGKLIFRFDDTNPEKEKESFEKIIEGDIELLGIRPDMRTYTSDYFERMLQMASQMIENELAYVDDTEPERMKQEREQRIESANRTNSVARNLEMWREMVDGTERGQSYCLRAKINMQSDNGALRDPTIYRCKAQEHPRHGAKYRVYPTYDFACPIVDSVEGVTHALRTSEYMDRDAQYYWFCDALQIRKPLIAAYSRLNLMNTVLSKRKLTFFVEQGLVDGWDDPRMPTVRGILRRGLTVDGLKSFIASQGSSKAVVVMDWDKIWAFNRKVIDPVAARYCAVEQRDAVPVEIEDELLPATAITVALHPKNAQLGERQVPIGRRLLVDQADAQLMQPDSAVTFIGWGNIRILQVERDPTTGLVTLVKARLDLDNRDFKKTLKVTWLEAESKIDAMLLYYDHIIRKPVLAKDDDFKQYINADSKMAVPGFVDGQLASLTRGTIIQIQRKGFFICDRAADSSGPLHLISVPDGTTDLNIYPKVVQEWKKKNQWVEPKSQGGDNPSMAGGCADELHQKIQQQGDKIRQLKADKSTDKKTIEQEVQTLLQLKAKFKEATGSDWKPTSGAAVAPSQAKSQPTQQKSAAAAGGGGCGDELNQQIQQQGDKIRQLKADKSTDKKTIEQEVQTLLQLKAKFKEATGSDWKPASGAATAVPPRAKSQPKEPKPGVKTQPHKEQKPAKAAANNSDLAASKPGLKKQTRLGIETKKADNYSEWYTEVITKAEMIEYYDVSGCYILRPWAYSIWETIQSYFDARIKALGVQNCYFPMFISKSALETEQTHIADFAPEVAWVTKSGSSDLAEPIAIRPTSETVMYPSYAKWVQSHRDLPIRLNQWCNVVRWEFKQPTPFLRTREFLWQEGHSAFATETEALEEVHTILGFYADIYEQLLAIPVIRGRKTEKEKFAGGQMTTTCEAYVHVNGRGIQGATSHFLGQNFSRMFDIQFEDPEQAGHKLFAYQNSWGISTRTIGALIMIHGDDKGLVLPPRVACQQVVIVPCGITASATPEQRDRLVDACRQLHRALTTGSDDSAVGTAPLRVVLDHSDHHSPGWKFNHWELKGVPVRIELGPKDIEAGQFVAVRRDTGAKQAYPLADAGRQVRDLLDQIQREMFGRAKRLLDDNLAVTESWPTLLQHLDRKAIIMAPFCGSVQCEERIKKDSAKDEPDAAGGPLMGAKSLCIPFEQPKPVGPDTRCVHPDCGQTAAFYTLFGRSY